MRGCPLRRTPKGIEVRVDADSTEPVEISLTDTPLAGSFFVANGGRMFMSINLEIAEAEQLRDALSRSIGALNADSKESKR